MNPSKIHSKVLLCLAGSAVFVFSFIFALPALAATIEISNITDLQKIGNDAGYPVDGDYILTQDIDASATASWDSEQGFDPISGDFDGEGNPTNPFTGVFDGQGHTITGLVIARPSEFGIGLFGVNIGEIKNLGLLGGTIVGHNYVGSIVGYNAGTITGSYSSSIVTGEIGVGGLAGINGGDILNCYATGAVTGSTASAGGLIGTNIPESTVRYCYATGAVVMENSDPEVGIVGGLMASNLGTVEDSYWDIETTGQALSSGSDESLYGTTTANMMKQTTFSGWDFETTPIWWINEGVDYPKLQALTSYTLTYTAGTGGSITGDSSQTVLRSANGTAVTAVPATGYSFSSWSDASTTNSRIDTNVTANVSVTATFAINTFTLAYTAGTGGSITGTASQTVDYGSSGSAVTATADSGYRFTSWSDGSTANPRTDTNITADKSVTASFEVVSSGSGYVAPPAGVGSGSSDVAATAIGSTLNVGTVTSVGTNVLTYVTNLNNFSTPESSSGGQLGNHSFQITDLDLFNY
ncbi:MAG: InlB B-repeat-containing protein, partial [Patescibacteria group bacterium]